MVDVVTTAIINRPRTVVAAYASDPDNAPKWYKNIKSVAWKTPPPLTTGSRIAFVAQFLGRTLAYVYQITEFVPEEKLVMRTTDGPFLMETTYEWGNAGEGVTQMTLRNRGGPTGFGAIFSPFMKLAMRSANRKDLQKLKANLETQA